MKTALAVACVFMSMVIPACNTGDVGGQPSRAVSLPPSWYPGIAWLPDGTIVVADTGRLTDEEATSRLLFLDGPSANTPVPVPADDKECLADRYLQPVALGDGSVAFLELCSVDEPGRIPAPDWFLRSLHGPSDPPLPFLIVGPLEFFPGPFSASPTLDRALVSAGDSLCGSLIWVEDGLVRYPDIVIDDEAGNSWNLGASFDDSSPASCTDQGRASWPAWAPDGSRIAFLGSPDSVGVAGQARLEVPWNLYVMAPSATAAESVLEGIGHARALSWSPDSRWLAFGGEVDGRKGTWVFNTDTQRVVFANEAEARWLAWSPAGDEIAAIIPAGPEPEALDSTITVIDVGLIVG